MIYYHCSVVDNDLSTEYYCLTMRRLFSQKLKHKTVTGSPIVMPLVPFNQDEENKIEREKTNSPPSYTQITTITTSENEIKTSVDDSILTEISIHNLLKQDDGGEKCQKLFVVVSGKSI